ncbi:MAG: hypothetical protein J0H29_07030 [Sphingobacteriales bacterium]|nr:hypothetical protein [Sphingobacteriales bacterium]
MAFLFYSIEKSYLSVNVIDMSVPELTMIIVFIVALFFINIFLSTRYPGKIAPDKIEGARLIGLAFLLGIFYIAAFEGSHSNGFLVALVILTVHFIQRSYKWIMGLNAKEA